MKTIQNDIEQIRTLKKNDPEINLYILLDQTDSIVTNAVELELKTSPDDSATGQGIDHAFKTR